MALKTVDLTPRIGTEVQVDKATLLSGKASQEIRQLLIQRGVIVVRGIAMRDDEQRAFTQTLGKLRLGTVKAEGEQGLMKVTHDRKENPVYAEFFPGTFSGTSTVHMKKCRPLPQS